jgi:hypothetical protein
MPMTGALCLGDRALYLPANPQKVEAEMEVYV